MKSLGAVVITFNEEKNIGRCLASLEGVVDEIVVVDSFSTDATESICKKFKNVLFLQREWTGFSDQRNFANTHIQSEYILTLDADEELSSEMQSEVLKVREKLSGNTAYKINRLTQYCGRWIQHSGWNPDYQLRLFPREGSSWDGASVHESVILPEGATLHTFQSRVYHFSYSSVKDHMLRAVKYSQLGAEQMVQTSLKKNKKNLCGLYLWKSVTRPWFRFFKTYFVKRGFLDGYHGFCISVIASFGVFLKYFMAYELVRNTDNTDK